MNSMNPMSLQPSALVAQANRVPQPRRGCIAARIGSEHMYTTTIAARTGIKSALTQTILETVAIRPGSRVCMGVQDLTQFPDIADKARWVCTHHECRIAKKSWPTKAALLAGHEDNRILEQKQETHLYYAVVELPAQDAVQAKRDDKGREITAAQEAHGAIVMLFSDEA